MAHIDRFASGRRSPLGMIAIAVVLLVSVWLVFDALRARPSAPAPSATPSRPAVGQPSLTPDPAATPSGHPTAPSTDAGGTPTDPGATPTSRPSASATPSPTPPPIVAVDMPFVPVTSFWTTERGITREQLAAAVGGTSERFSSVILPADDAAAIAGALGVPVGANVATGSVDEVRAAVAGGALAVIRLTDVTPAVRALALDGASLFGNERVDDLAAWPLRATVEGPPLPDQAQSWTLVAGGDVMLDRSVGHQIFTQGKGADYPWDGGTARITSIYCCSSFGWPVPRTERTGNRGAVRELISGGDLAIANLETSVRRDATPNTGGLTFVSDPATVAATAEAGFDFMSLANNHIGDGGRPGILTAIDVLDELGLAYAGAGRTPAEALEPAYFDVNGTRLAILACDWIAPRYWVRDDRVGAQSCRHETLLDGIRDADAQADVVIVFPHWGKEYRAEPRVYQRRLAREWTGAGADMVIGAHSHWAGAIEELDGKLVFYSLGNLVFDQSWQAQTQMGVIVEITFHGERPVQAWLHPTVILDQAQPNLLTTDADLRRVLDQMRDGSEGLLPY